METIHTMPASIPSTWVRHCSRATHTMKRSVLRVSGRPGSGNGISRIRVPTVGPRYRPSDTEYPAAQWACAPCGASLVLDGSGRPVA